MLDEQYTATPSPMKGGINEDIEVIPVSAQPVCFVQHQN